MRKSVDNLLTKRFWQKVEKTEGCWNWLGAVTRAGYGRFKSAGTMKMAHRVAWELLKGPIPAGLTLDHLCRNTRCVNPGHLEPVTPRTNVLRGNTITAANAAKISCKNGHPLRGRNLFIRRDGRRRCRICERASQKRARSTSSYRSKHAAYERQRRAAKAA